MTRRSGSRIIEAGPTHQREGDMRRTWHRMWLRGIVATPALVGTIGMSAGLPVPSALAQGGEVWGERAPMLLPRSEASVAELNGKIYVIGGELGNPNGSPFQDGVYMLDEGAGAWLTKAPMPTARSGGGSAVIDGKI